MNDLRSPLGRTAVLAAVAVAALAMTGCTKKVTNVDSGFTTPEGQYNADAQLVVYPDLALTAETWTDLLPDGPGVEDTLVSTRQIPIAPGAVRGMIMDGTLASGYQVLRREGNGGYAQLKDYVLNPVARFLESQWELYSFIDVRPCGFSPPTYVGRGVVAGQVTTTSPLTNVGEVAAQTVPALTYTGQTAPQDSNITMSWQPVPDAAGYWIQIYQFRGSSVAQLFSSQPAPFVFSTVRNFFVGYVPAPASSYKLGEPGAKVLARRSLLMAVQYLVRISAVNERGEMIAFSYGDWDYVRAAGSYQRYRLGAIKVTPTRPSP